MLVDMSFDELLDATVELPGKYSQKIDDSPSIISVISHEQISTYGANSLLEVLERATSINMLGSFFYPQNLAVVRGVQLTHSSNEILFLINGRPLRDSFTGGQNFAFFTAFPVSNIEQVEFVRGPGSVLYGSNAFSGAINIVTKKEPTTQVTASIGEYQTRDLEFSVSDGLEEGYWNLSGKLFTEDGWEHRAIDNSNVPGGFDTGERNHSLLFNGKSGKFEWSAVLADSTQDFWGAVSAWNSGPPQDEREVSSQRISIDLGYEWTLSDTAYLQNNISYTTSDFSHYNYDANSKNWFLESTYHNQEFWGGHLIAGATAWHQKIGTEDGLRAGPIEDVSRNWYNAYAQYQKSSSDSVNWWLGLQYNKVADVDPNVVLRAGVNYQIDDNSGVKLMWGEAYRAAYSVETNFNIIVCCDAEGNNRGGLRGNPELDPEESNTYEAQYYWKNERGQVAVSAFYTKLDSLISRVRAADRVLDFVNEGELDSHGLEVEGQYLATNQWHLDFSATYQENDAHGVDDYTLMPNWMFKVGSRYLFNSGANLGVFASYYSKFHSNEIRNPDVRLVNPESDAHLMITAKFSYPLNLGDTQSNLFIYAYNLTDEDIYQPEIGGRNINTHPSRSGRALYAGVEFRF